MSSAGAPTPRTRRIGGYTSVVTAWQRDVGWDGGMVRTHTPRFHSGAHTTLTDHPLSPPTTLPHQVVGELDTVTGGLEFVARAEKVFGPMPASTAPWRVKRAALSTPRASLGVSYCSRRDAVLARAAVSGAEHLGGELWFEAAAAVEGDVRALGEGSGGGGGAPPRRVPAGRRAAAPARPIAPAPPAVAATCRLALSKNVFDFAPCQQVRVSVGVDGVAAAKGGGAAWRPWASVRENNWSAWLDHRGRVSVRYDL